MSGKRKDTKGRVLKTGESQRKDLIYMYRYTDNNRKRQSVYASTLKELREKEAEIQKKQNDGIDYARGKASVIELVERYVGLKTGVRTNTKVGYQFVINLLREEEFGNREIKDICISDAQMWFKKLQDEGRGYSTITTVRGVVKPAFQMAVNEDVLPKNPFIFKLTDVVVNDSKHREALTEEQQAAWMDFVKNDKTYAKYYDEFFVLLNTGMRVSEFCGLTKADLDFKKRRIRVDHQLLRDRDGSYHVEKTKTESGCRYIPMTELVYQSLKNMLKNRPIQKTEPMIDGYSGFIMIDKHGNPKVALHIENQMRWGLKKYQKQHPEAPLPNITPHVLRHTFRTNMAHAGMDVKNLQYLMGHSDVSVTLNVYTHASYDKAADQMAQIIEIGTAKAAKESRKSG